MAGPYPNYDDCVFCEIKKEVCLPHIQNFFCLLVPTDKQTLQTFRKAIEN